MKILVSAAALTVLFACAPPQAAHEQAPAAQMQAASVEGLPAGAYTIDPSHTSVLFRVDHLGFSKFTARFSEVSADLQLDPAHPDQAALNVRLDPGALDLSSPPEGFLDVLRGDQLFDVEQFPEMSYRSIVIEMTGPDTARFHGDLTLHGVTKPVVLEARFNGGWAGIPQDPHARIGFSAHGSLKRSDFGMDFGVPAPGSTMGVGDEVEIIIEAEFTGPAWAGAEGAP